MIGSNFVFVHINKTGGSSIESALKWYGLKKGKEFHVFEEQVKFYHAQHFMVKDYIKVLGCKEYKEKFSCTIVRNPWDRMLSYFAFAYKQRRRKFSKKEFSDFIVATFKTKEGWELAVDCDFPRKCDSHERMIRPCTYWIEGGVDFVGRFENLQQSYETIRAKINVPSRDVLPYSKFSRNKGRDYRPYYTDEAAAIIEVKFASDIKAFGYKF